MRLGVLYLRSRIVGRTVAVLAAVALATWLWVWWSGTAAATVTLLPLTMPLAAAAIIGTSTGSPFGESEATASRSLRPLRCGHSAGLLVVAAVALAFAGLHWSVTGGAWLLLRNLAGFTGLALLAARVLGSGLCWVVPLAYAVLSLLIPTSGNVPAWAWSVRAADDRAAALGACALLLAGLAVITLVRARDARTAMTV